MVFLVLYHLIISCMVEWLYFTIFAISLTDNSSLKCFIISSSQEFPDIFFRLSSHSKSSKQKLVNKEQIIAITRYWKLEGHEKHLEENHKIKSFIAKWVQFFLTENVF